MNDWFFIELGLVVLMFANFTILIAVLTIGALTMDAINQAIENLNRQVKAVQDYVAILKGQAVDPVALSAAADSITQASAALEALTK